MSKSIRSAQGQIEARNFEIRKNVLKYDEVMNKQRTVMYKQRQRILEGEDLKEQIAGFIDRVLTNQIVNFLVEDKPEDWNLESLKNQLKNVYPITLDFDEIATNAGGIGSLSQQEIIDPVLEDAHKIYEDRESFVSEENMRNIEREIILTVLDRRWRQHLYEMDYLKEGIGLRAMAQKDPLVEYSIEGSRLFDEMNYSIMEESVGFLFNINLPSPEEMEQIKEQQRLQKEAETLQYSAPDDSTIGESEVLNQDQQISTRNSEGRKSDGNNKQQANQSKGTANANQSASPWSDGRTFPGTSTNSFCPCGSGKKYKLCHGRNEKNNSTRQKPKKKAKNKRR
jgi:preprotein translocase subunit SecA